MCYTSCLAGFLGGNVGSNEAARLVSALEGAFRAARITQDDLAANDLAFSLAQDIPLADDLLRRGGSLLIDEEWRPVDAVGHDYVRAGAWLVPTQRAVVELGSEIPPGREPTILLSRLRRLARQSAEVKVGTGFGEFAGRITKCASDHVQISGRRELAIPLGDVLYVRCAREGSVDVP